MILFSVSALKPVAEAMPPQNAQLLSRVETTYPGGHGSYTVLVLPQSSVEGTSTQVLLLSLPVFT